MHLTVLCFPLEKKWTQQNSNPCHRNGEEETFPRKLMRRPSLSIILSFSCSRAPLNKLKMKPKWARLLKFNTEYIILLILIGNKGMLLYIFDHTAEMAKQEQSKQNLIKGFLCMLLWRCHESFWERKSQYNPRKHVYKYEYDTGMIRIHWYGKT